MTFIALSGLSQANCISPQGETKHQWQGLGIWFNLKAISELLKPTVKKICGKEL